MAIRRKVIQRGDRVLYDGHECVVLNVSATKVILRDKYGFQKEVSKKAVKPAND